MVRKRKKNNTNELVTQPEPEGEKNQVLLSSPEDPVDNDEKLQHMSQKFKVEVTIPQTTIIPRDNPNQIDEQKMDIDKVESNAEKASGSKRSERKKRNKEKSVKLVAIDDPDKLLELVLADSEFKVPNLSEKLDEMLASNTKLKGLYQKIVYEDTIPDICEQTTVMPHGYESIKVEVPPEALTQLQCIYHKPPRGGYRRRGKVGSKKGMNQNQGRRGGGNAENTTSK